MPKKVINIALRTIGFSFPEKTKTFEETAVVEGKEQKVKRSVVEEGFEPLTFYFDKLPGVQELLDAGIVLPETVIQTALHGISQKVGDSYAGAAKDGPEVGLDPVVYAKNQIEAMFEQLYNGKWYAVRAAGGGAQNTMLVRAVSLAAGTTSVVDEETGETKVVPKLSLEEAVELVDAMDEDERKKTAKMPKVAAALAQLRAEAAVAKAKALAEKAQKAAEAEAAAGNAS